jgi:hypothetical protein
MRPPSPTGLYWSLYGEVACAEHAPQVEESRWHADGWALIEVRSGTVEGTRLKCQDCEHPTVRLDIRPH